MVRDSRPPFLLLSKQTGTRERRPATQSGRSDLTRVVVAKVGRALEDARRPAEAAAAARRDVRARGEARARRRDHVRRHVFVRLGTDVLRRDGAVPGQH